MRLRYTLPALADLRAILDYIAAHSPQGARRVQTRIKTLTDLLLQYPHIGRRTNDPAIHPEDNVPPANKAPATGGKRGSVPASSKPEDTGGMTPAPATRSITA